MKEGKVIKGGVNNAPTSDKPDITIPPQWGKGVYGVPESALYLYNCHDGMALVQDGVAYCAGCGCEYSKDDINEAKIKMVYAMESPSQGSPETPLGKAYFYIKLGAITKL